ATADDGFAAFLDEVRAAALERGISHATLDAAFEGLAPEVTVVERDRTQTETVVPPDEYIRRRVTAAAVRTGRARALPHRPVLARVAAHYGVQARFLVAIWGMESNYGRFSGVRPTMQALATLAWDGRRGAFFRGELLDALEIVDRGHIDLASMRGSWAGAMGQTQFIPTTFLSTAVDFDGDGRRDIWGTPADIFASIANYLKSHGWDDTQTWGREVRVGPAAAARVAGLPTRDGGCRARRSMTEPLPLARWQALGVRAMGGGALPAVDRDASLVTAGRRAFLVYGNYDALLAYNCAHPYALSVGLLADQVR
ncbi:MAG: lytic transglycosylase domain-containing protein, partial [Vicinamibacteria bacterium]